jgi:nucleolar protein 9
MPKENRKRGRRDEQKKRKRDVDDGESTTKRVKKEEVESIEVGDAFQHDAAADATRPEQLTFYGMLDEEEQEYFKRADEMLELNQFEDADARKLFLESVYKELDGKELKIVHSQSCSRLLERLILLSTPEQLKNLFQKFSGQ